MKTTIFSIFLWVMCCCILSASGLDNRPLLPPLHPDSEVQFEVSADGSTEVPDWLKSLIMVEVRIETAAEDHTLKSMPKVLDYLAELGVNGIWVSAPMNEHRPYTNFGIHTINPDISGEASTSAQWHALKQFVDECHSRNIRVFFDAVTWGVNEFAPIYKSHPEWFHGNRRNDWEGFMFDWKNPVLKEWFASCITEWLLMTGADGFRCDCEPGLASYDVYGRAKKRLRDVGRKVIFIAECASSRNNVFDLDQVAFWNHGDARPELYFLSRDIVETTRSGEPLIAIDNKEMEPGSKRFYLFNLLSHDTRPPISKGSPVTFCYQAIFSPYIPLWFLGEEWNNTDTPTHWGYHNPVQWEKLEQEPNRSFNELVKKCIRIRRTYHDIFEYFPDDHRESAICKVETDQPDLLTAYARYHNGVAVLIVPNNSAEVRTIAISIPVEEAGLPGGLLKITDLLEAKELGLCTANGFTVELPPDSIGVYLVEPQ